MIMSNVLQTKSMYQHDFESFVRFTFKTLYPYSEYLNNFHIALIADHLQRCERGEIKRLLINLPPRYLKSLMASVALPAWALGRNPNRTLLCIQGEQELASELETLTHKLMASDRYVNVFPHMKGLVYERSKIITRYGGHRQSATTSKSLIGKGADIIIVDDPISPQHVSDPSLRDQNNRWFDENINQRLNNKKDGIVIVVMQRLHPEDLSNYLLSKNEGWIHLNLPAIAMQDETWGTSDGRIFTREKGEALHPARESKQQLCDIMMSIRGAAFAMQYLQGLYKPRFGEVGWGCIWLTPMREGIKYNYNQEKDSNHRHGFYRFTEEGLMLPKVFGVGEDPCPPDMRHTLTDEEFDEIAAFARNNYENDVEKGIAKP